MGAQRPVAHRTSRAMAGAGPPSAATSRGSKKSPSEGPVAGSVKNNITQLYAVYTGDALQPGDIPVPSNMLEKDICRNGKQRTSRKKL